MKNLNIFATVIALFVAATVSAQDFEYETKSCKFTKEYFVNPSEWEKTPEGYLPKDENADPLIGEKAALCQGLYLRFAAGIATSGDLTMPEATASLGYQFNFKHHGPIGAKVEAIAGLAHTNETAYKDLMVIEKGLSYKFGGQVALDFWKHSSWGMSVYGGGGVQFINTSFAAKTLEQTDGKFLKSSYHGTSYYEGGIRLNRNTFGKTWSLGAGVQVVNTTHTTYTCGVVTLSVQLNRTKKSKPIKYSDYLRIKGY